MSKADVGPALKMDAKMIAKAGRKELRILIGTKNRLKMVAVDAGHKFKKTVIIPRDPLKIRRLCR
jgi:hypothetical protein